MRTLALIVVGLALLTFLPAPAQAQMSSSLVVTLTSAEEPVREGSSVVLTGIATFTSDWTAALSLNGIPVTYTIDAVPAWASVVISPANDVFPPPGPASGATPLAYSVTRAFTVTVSASEELAADQTDVLEIAATSSPTQGGRVAVGKASALVSYDAPEAPCDTTDHEALLAMAVEAANAYAETERGDASSTSGTEDDELSVQTGGATPLPLPWIAVGGFAALGALVGLLLRRRLAR